MQLSSMANGMTLNASHDASSAAPSGQSSAMALAAPCAAISSEGGQLSPVPVSIPFVDVLLDSSADEVVVDSDVAEEDVVESGDWVPLEVSEGESAGASS